MRVVVVCGSRYKYALPETVTDAKNVVREIVASFDEETMVVTGGAPGVDTWAHLAARSRGLATEVVYATWRPGGVYNPRAGFMRNLEMLDRNPDLVVAVWDGTSTGTRGMIGETKKRGMHLLQVQVVK